MNKSLQAHLAVLTVNIIYGANFSIAKQVMPAYIKPFALVTMRCGGALVLFWLISFFFIKEKIDKKDLPRIALLAACGVACNQLLFLKGLSLTSPINASIIMISNPIIVLLMARLFLNEHLSLNRISGISLGIAGALLMLMYNKNFKFGSETIAGDLMILINATSWACYIVLVKPLMKKYNTFTIIKWVFLFGFIYVLPFGFNEFKSIQWNTMTTGIWWDIAFVVIATTFVAYLLNTYALRALSPAVVSIYIYIQPFVATLIAVFYFHNDTLDAHKIISALLIIAGVTLVSRPTESDKKEKEIARNY